MKTVLMLCLSFFSFAGFAQTGEISVPASNRNNKIETSVERRTTAPGATSLAAQDVLFATNEDCDLFINDQLKGTVSKNKYLYVKIEPGTYSYRARSKYGADELKDSFEVKEGGSTEVFIDLLYVIDENNKSRVVQNESGSSNPVDKSNLDKEQVARAAITALLSSMVRLKGGSFTMGNNKSLVEDEIEHDVTISPILFNKYEVTQQQWEDIMGYNPSANKGCANCPVENVSWEEVMKFIARVNVIGEKKFRLPTEAEWEYVAKIGGRTEIDSAGGQEEYIKKTAWYFANSEKKTHPVGEKLANTSGIFDLYGNVSEWCSDWYGSYYYKEDYNQKNPQGPPLGKEKVIRGGSFMEYVGDHFRPSFRNKLKPTGKSNDVGFRLVMDLY